MIGIDTNVLVRYLAQDDPDQTRIATELIENKCSETDPAFINHIVLCETVWVLERLYHVKKSLIAEILEKILNTEQFEIQMIDIVWRALQEFKLKNKIDFADCLLSQINIENGCRETVTFDKAAAETSGYNLL
ncbi:MAG: type II toxin-antitoxin system VapC family toxin [Pseudomonadota bacterium]